MSEVKLQAEDAIKLILQFCREHGLENSFATLQEESGVHSNFINSPEDMLANIRAGNWNFVIKALRH
jgi:WD40 repeat-containing protein SMU1